MEAGDLIRQADRISREQGLTQSEWCRRSGFDQYGKLVSNMFRRGDCKLTVLTKLLKPLGYEVRIMKKEDTNERLAD